MNSKDTESGIETSPVDWWNLTAVLDYFEHNSLLVLEQHGAQLDGLQVKRDSISDLSDSDRDLVQAAAQVLLRVFVVRECVENRDTEDAVLNMMQLVRAAVELMPMKQLAVRAQRSRRGLEKAHDQRRATGAAIRELCQETAHRIRERSPSLSAWYVALLVSDRLERDHNIPLGQRQVHRHIRDLWQRQ